jgi:hypothetical protein
VTDYQRLLLIALANVVEMKPTVITE